ncbi:hypothetical protein [Inquilinus limosus]|uniref:Uncharacterized protein n=1 Tax=Inquilinus limosus MP06 TaxID=1398085 RepID=A0A0A0D9G0_9PROT|nr:hypothetical protein [Inquilinus limosus]KGM34690.1 hypothetical protein P409_08815 [Inquilinus limosus MP06]
MKPESTLPPPEVVARRGTAWQDQDAGDIFGIMQARGLISPDLKIAGQSYAGLVHRYERLIGAPICATQQEEGGRGTAPEDPVGYARSRARMLASLAVLRRLDHRCLVAMARAVAAVTHEQIADTLQWAAWIAPALQALHEAADEIRAAGRTAAGAMMEAA